MLAIFKSKKFQAAALGLVVVVVSGVLEKLGVHVSDDSVTQIVGLLAVYVLGQGMADWGKSSKPPV